MNMIHMIAVITMDDELAHEQELWNYGTMNSGWLTCAWTRTMKLWNYEQEQEEQW